MKSILICGTKEKYLCWGNLKTAHFQSKGPRKKITDCLKSYGTRNRDTKENFDWLKSQTKKHTKESLKH